MSRSFGNRSTSLDVVEGLDLSGKTAIVTGASSGIGVETVRAFAAAGASVILAVRDVEKGKAVARDVHESTGNDRLDVAPLDLSSFDGIRRFAREFLDRKVPLHILANNAGVMACPLARTEAGHELQLATNHLGHFLLTGLLAPALRSGAPARVVNVSSVGHRLSSVDLDDPHFERREYDKWVAYGQSKTANVLHAVELDRRLGERGVHAFAVHPGGIMTDLQRHLPREEMEAFGWIDSAGNLNDRFKTIPQGAATTVFAATAPELDGRGGLYLEDCKVAEPAASGSRFSGVAPHALDAAAARRLWEISEPMVGETFPLS